MVKLKQYLENSWYRWASQDRQTGYASQYQYWYGVNTRDMKNWVCLAWWTTSVLDVWEKFVYFCRQNKLYTLSYSWVIKDISWVEKCTISSFWNPEIVVCENFWDYLFIATDEWKIFQVEIATWTDTNISSLVPAFHSSSFICMLNYANTYLLIWCSDVLIRIDLITWLSSKVIRDFDSSYHIVWLTQEGNYLKIYTTDNKDTKIHYAKGTFDVEYTWLIQTVSFKWLSIPRNCVTHDQGNDYVLFRVEDWEYKLAKISWYHKTDIRWTQIWWWEMVFTADEWWLIWPSIYASDWVLFANMADWIWTFTEYNGWLRWWCCEFPTAWNAFTYNMFKFWEWLYYCAVDTAVMCDMSFHPQTYQSNWFIIGRVFDWWCAGLFKKNDQATITYNMPVGTSMELSYRYDRSSFWYNRDEFLTIKKLEDTNECYDIVVPTTPANTDVSLLSKESWINDLILLENGNWIQLEDLLVIPFNKTWNLLEYRFDLETTDTSKTPILFEHSLTYYDYMRKYR